MFPLVLVVLLLIVRTYALSRLATRIDWRFLVAAPMAVSLLTYFAYRTDKRRAEAGEWRIPESTLHFAELIGEWPGAFLAQRKFRHKISKTSYQITFWAIVLAASRGDDKTLSHVGQSFVKVLCESELSSCMGRCALASERRCLALTSLSRSIFCWDGNLRNTSCTSSNRRPPDSPGCE